MADFKTQKNRGFTLIELIVVMAVFMMVIGAAIGVFVSIVKNQRIILSEQELLNQTSYIEEYMSKALRMATKDYAGNCLIDASGQSPNPSLNYPGYNYLLTRPVGNIFTGIKFLNQSNTDDLGNPICQEFYLDMSSVPYTLKELKTYWVDNYAYDGDADAVPLSSAKLNISLIKFGIDGSDGSLGAGNPIGDQDAGFSSFQPRITMLMNIEIQGDSEQPTRAIQTTVSQRNLNAQ